MKTNAMARGLLLLFFLLPGVAVAQPLRDATPLGPMPSVAVAAAQWSEEVLPLAAALLRLRAELGLSPQQTESLEQLSADFTRELIRRRAEVLIAALDLGAMLDVDPKDPAKPLDLTRAETKVRDIERIAGDMLIARLRATEAAKVLLNAEQRAKLGGLLEGNDPPDPSAVIPTASHAGGGVPGHPGGGAPGGGPGGGSRPAPSHPGTGGPWHSPTPPHHGTWSHPGIYGGAVVGVWPWYWWGYPAPVYPAPIYPAPVPPSYWYYCPAYGAYYPDVTSCPQPWVPVPAG
ncbi:MAG TPA: hypothetical protein VMS64_39535 [Candidatus Methylomirabilis sp.]|nr:hypothetical protein [Candidatus Methylomirabilis sp.]